MGVSFHWLNWRLYVFNRFKILFGCVARLRELVVSLACARWLWRFASLAGCGARCCSLVVALASLAGCGARCCSLVVALRFARWVWRFASLAGFGALLRSLGLLFVGVQQ